MLLILAEANAFDTSRAYNGGGLRPPLPKWGRRPSAAGPIWGIHYMLQLDKLLCKLEDNHEAMLHNLFDITLGGQIATGQLLIPTAFKTGV